MTSAVGPCHPSNSHLCHKHSRVRVSVFVCVCVCECVCVCVCVAILHDSGAAGLLCAAEVDVRGQRRVEKHKKNQHHFGSLFLMFSTEILHQDILEK